jgi:citrate synthase
LGVLKGENEEIVMDSGLENVVAAETVLSDVDGHNGRLIIRGHELSDLAGSAQFEDVIALLWGGFFDETPEKTELIARLAAARVAAFAALPDLSKAASPVEALRIALACVSDGDGLETALSLVAMSGVATAAAARIARGEQPLPPNPNLSHSADILAMLSGFMPNSDEIGALDAYLVTVSDHGLNASTFAARVVASTRAGLGSAVIAGLSALKGPLHGGAPGPVLDMFDSIGVPENAEAWIEAALARGERLMGFGHRVYRVRDPRADALKLALGRMKKNAGRLEFAEEIETKVLKRLALRYPARTLETNVEFYTALLLEALAIPRGVFTCIFGCGRIAGWIGHAQEQLTTNRLVRPKSVYVGPVPRLAA